MNYASAQVLLLEPTTAMQFCEWEDTAAVATTADGLHFGSDRWHVPQPPPTTPEPVALVG